MAQEFDRRERTFNALFDAYYTAVRAYAWRRDTARADDIVAETFLVAWKRLDDVPRETALPWLLAVARNTHLNMRRTERRRSAREVFVAQREGASDVQHEAPDDDETRVLRLLARLSEPDQELLRLVAWEGLDRAAIAQVLGCSKANVAVRLHRARRRFGALLAEDEALLGIARRYHCLVEGGLQND